VLSHKAFAVLQLILVLLQLLLSLLGFGLCLFDVLFLFVKDDSLLFNLLTKCNGLFIKFLFVALFVHLLVPCLLNLLAKFLYCAYVVVNLLLALLLAVEEVTVSLTDTLHTLVLLLSRFQKLLILFTELFEDFLFSKFYILLAHDLKRVYLRAQLLDLFPLLFFLVTLVLDLFISLAHLLLQGLDAFDLAGSHADSRAYITGLLKYLVVSLLAFFDIDHLLFVSGFQRIVYVLILLLECLEILVPDDLIQEHFELAFHVFELFRLHAHLLDLFLELHFILDRFVVDVAPVILT
jgi:hypothetical protein